MAYTGPERRIHRVIVTRNTEYHMRRRTCIRVRDRQSGRWLDSHRALAHQMTGSVSLVALEPDINLTDVPLPGESVFFGEGDELVITSPVLYVQRPPKHLVLSAYPPDTGVRAQASPPPS